VLGPIASNDSGSTTGDDQKSDEDKKKDKDDSDADDQSVQAWLGLINAGPINLSQPIEEPVTSGSDINFDVGEGPGGAN
jgi:hypothetical protein